jgi:hypothetical protein
MPGSLESAIFNAELSKLVQKQSLLRRAAGRKFNSSLLSKQPLFDAAFTIAGIFMFASTRMSLGATVSG